MRVGNRETQVAQPERGTGKEDGRFIPRPEVVWPGLLRFYRSCVERESGFRELLQRSGGLEKYVFVNGGGEALFGAVEGVASRQAEVRALALRAQEQGEALFYGYPLLVFREEGEGGEQGGGRFKLGPLFVSELALPGAGVPLPEFLVPRQDEPVFFEAALEQLGWKAEQQARLLESLNLGEWEANPERAREGLSDLLEELGIPACQPLDPGQLGAAGEGKVKELGAHNVGIVFRTDRAVYHFRLLEELKGMETRWAEARGTAAAFLFGPPGEEYFANKPKGPALAGVRPRKKPPAGAGKVELAAPIPLNDAQRKALAESFERPLTVVTGPPGTGKSQLVTCLVASAWLSGQSVLVASTNNQAVNVACARAQALWPGLVIRTGSKEYRDAAKEALVGLVREKAAIPDLGALSVCFEGARKNAAEALGAIESRTVMEERLGELQLGREELVRHLNWDLQALEGGFDARALAKWSRRLTRWCQGQGKFRQWGMKRLGRRIGRPVEEKLPQYETLFRLEEEWRRLRTLVADQAGFDDLWRVLCAADRQAEQAGGSFVTAAARANFREGVRHLQRLALALAHPKGRNALQEAFPKALPFARGWASTALSVGGTIPLLPALFDLVVIDEASQCSIPAVLPLLFRARRAVIIGDPMQLAHITTLARQAEAAQIQEAGLDGEQVAAARLSFRRDSAYRALEKSVDEPHLLDEHYRSHPDIIEISNRLFYHRGLKVLTDPQVFLSLDLPAVAWRHVEGRAVRPAAGSAFNEAEVQAVVEVVLGLAGRPGMERSVGVVTPFALQAEKLGRALDAALPEEVRRRLQLAVGTAHRFQGDERDVMIFSPVVAPGLPEASIGWLMGTPNLFNVAITRARAGLIVAGHRGFCLGLEGPLGELATYIRDLETQEQVAQAGVEGRLHSQAEARLYQALLSAGLEVTPKVRLQGYEADFLIQQGKVVINLECDGRHHRDSAGRLRRQDRARDSLLEAAGWRVLRFPAWQCLANPQAVAARLLTLLPPSSPTP